MDVNKEVAVNEARASRWKKSYNISLKQIIIILLVVSLFLVFFANIEAHANWDLMREQAYEYGYWMSSVYGFFPSYVQNNTFTGNLATEELVTEHLLQAGSCVGALATTDPQHFRQLSVIQNFLMDLPYSDTVRLNDTSKAILLDDLDGLVYAIPNAYNVYSIPTSSANTDWGAPPFWYFSTDPCNETTLQNAVALATQGSQIMYT